MRSGSAGSVGSRDIGGHNRGLCHGRRHPGVAQLRRRAGIRCRCLCFPTIHQDAGDLGTPILAHVPVDFELHGCPINKAQLPEVISAFLAGRKPAISGHSVCVECKLHGNVCVMVQGTPCLGLVTHAGCGALCPSFRRGCYGCFGPMERPNTAALASEWRKLGATPRDIRRVFRTVNAAAEPFRKESEAHGE